jgi:hypothetical protein
VIPLQATLSQSTISVTPNIRGTGYDPASGLGTPISSCLLQRVFAAPHTAGYEGIFVPKWAESRLYYPWESPYVPTVIATVGPKDCLIRFIKKTFEVCCVVGHSTSTLAAAWRHKVTSLITSRSL